MATRWTIRHGLMLLWFTDLMNVAEEINASLTSSVTIIKSVNQSSIKTWLNYSVRPISFHETDPTHHATPMITYDRLLRDLWLSSTLDPRTTLTQMGQLLLMSSSHIRLSFYIISTLLLFYALQITQQGKERWLVLSQRLKIKAFAKNVKMLLESQPDGVIALGNFVSTYMKFFGQKCKIATFGFAKLTDLIEAVPNVAKVC